MRGRYSCNLDSATGIPVDIIVPAHLEKIDPMLVPSKNPRHMIINIDYAFGKQAEHIIRALIVLFHKNIKTFNIMGKAGALTGKRGDLLLATQVLLARDEQAYPMLEPQITEENPFLHCVHKGAVLTVEGTLLQNRPLLNYYKTFWKCVGLEMEGSFYARQIQRAQHQNLLCNEVESNFLYFVSDLPLEEGSQLSKDMEAYESVPPIYGIIRAFLHNIFTRET